MAVDPTIFREYDIRGLVDGQLTPEAVRLVGRAYATMVAPQGVQRVTVGRDCRDSSPRLAAALREGLTAGGLDVIDVGMVTTPMQYFSIFHFDADGGVQITGSHNPPEYNGLKISVGKTTIYGPAIQELRRIIEAGAFHEPSRAGTITEADVVTPYTEYTVGNIQLGPRRLKVVADAGNGTAGPFVGPILSKLGVDFVPLYLEPDATFPNHHPDPTVEENLEDLIATVRREKADLGLAWDGDADRVGAVDEQGNILWGDQMMILFSRAVLAERPGAAIVAEVKCSKTLYDDIAKRGGRAIMWKAGHSLIKGKMKEEHAELAGEMSGHIFFKHRWFGFDDGIYASLRLLELLSKTEAPLSALLADVPKTESTPELRVDCPEALKFPLVRAMIEHFKAKGHRVIDIDGARVELDDGWGLIRASNTQAILVLRFEAESKARLAEIRAYVEGELAKVRATLER
ncbi:phosphomannomutase/phosphoglucomutase [Myxococcota bacterium]|nr:phosphomannomutase/phosphoglucomutase [Myxococcota bacterium]